MTEQVASSSFKPHFKKPNDLQLFLIMGGLVIAVLVSVLSMGQVWHDGHEALRGAYEAAEVVDIGGGRYRMYYDLEASPQAGIYSAISSDAIHWKEEPGVRKEKAGWPSVTKLEDGRWRMYFHTDTVVKSAISADGSNWTDEPGIRMDASNTNTVTDPIVDDASEPAVRKMADGTWLMVYTGIINQKYLGAPTGSNRISLFLWATSSDGLNFDKKGLAIDSRNDTFNGQINGPEIVTWSDGTVHLFFWSSKGIYDAPFKNNNAFIDPRLAFAKGIQGRQAPTAPPADPTLLKVGNKWFMYYQEHNKGIYYATLGIKD